MEAILTNGVACLAQVEEFFHRNFRKDEYKPIYIAKRTEILYQMIND